MNKSLLSKFGDQPLDLDEFFDVEFETGWRREDLQSLRSLLEGLAIIVAIITLGLLLG